MNAPKKADATYSPKVRRASNKMRRRLCFAPDLVNDTAKIVEYEQFRRPGGAWPHILDDIRRPH